LDDGLIPVFLTPLGTQLQLHFQRSPGNTDTVSRIRPHSIILASCKPGFRFAWTCRKQVESQLQTCLKPSDDRTSSAEIDAAGSRPSFRQKQSKACRKPARTCRKPGCKPGRKPGLQLVRI